MIDDENKLDLVLDDLTARQRAFVLNYLGGPTMLNATGSARLSGYASPNQIAFQILRNDRIQEIVKEFLSNLTMSKDEVLARLSEMARADISQFLRINQHGELEIDFNMVLSKGYLIKSCYQDSRGNWRLELHDSMRALELVGKSQNLFTDRMDVSVYGGGTDERDSKYMESLMKVFSNHKERYDRVENDDGEIELVEKESLTDEDRARLDSELEQAEADIASETERLLGTDGKAAVEAAKASDNYYVRDKGGRRK